MYAITLIIIAIVMTAFGTALVRRYALSRQIVDVPSERGLHDRVVARGGGAVIVIVVTILLTYLVFTGVLDHWRWGIWIAAGLGFGLLGWIDDRVGLPATIRLVAQSTIAVIYCGALHLHHPYETTNDIVEYFPMVVPVLAVVLVWFVNLYNFIDGADGYAATEAIAVAGCGAILIAAFGSSEEIFVALLITGAGAGFLPWNWQPARIFMGDVGSYFLGFQFGALVVSGCLDRSGPWLWLILLMPFVIDATLTLVRRAFNRENWWTAHRSHAYQLLVLSGWSHARLCVALVVITGFVLLPVGLFIMRNPAYGFASTVAIYSIAAIIWAAIIKRTYRRA